MITITVGDNSLKAEGHANYDLPGKDIVCSAVSTLMQTLELRGEATKAKGYMFVHTDDKEALQLCLDGLKMIERNFPVYVEVIT
ncbi:ribosomal-processing cysteine protease Prp [Desulfosporosinus hippei]|uniref:Ribosomal processing cysteine protease Prp n=1 Tax=Desulfosporosinus hippei DSM 8344 TaxID=1121419 RepID=A0A1G7UJT2_9FIRM|nr:ribosomal-processing cysteine protease Prp [Desulfosporosinus hippei]SDG47786.1 Uncharacterized conserved protein YsxB, DUF464 family [Desulfosporosinus hippei DSM 8344]